MPSDLTGSRRQSYPSRLAPIAANAVMNIGAATTPHAGCVRRVLRLSLVVPTSYRLRGLDGVPHDDAGSRCHLVRRHRRSASVSEAPGQGALPLLGRTSSTPPRRELRVDTVEAGGLDARIRLICHGFPGVTEKPSHGTPAFFAVRQFVTLWPDGHHGERFGQMWCAALPGIQDELVETEPDRFFRPPYVGVRGWLGVRLDGVVDWDEIEGICEEAFRTVAPRRSIELLDQRSARRHTEDR